MAHPEDVAEQNRIWSEAADDAEMERRLCDGDDMICAQCTEQVPAETISADGYCEDCFADQMLTEDGDYDSE